MQKILKIISQLIEDTKINHRDYEQKYKEKNHRKSPEYKRWYKNWQSRKKGPGYHKSHNISKAAERSARFKRDY